jgi:hypothetical protein
VRSKPARGIRTSRRGFTRQPNSDPAARAYWDALALGDKDKACKRPRSEACKLAEVDEKLLTARLSDAKARDKAQAILKPAKDEAKAGPAEASMVATVIAGYTGGDPASVARIIGRALRLRPGGGFRRLGAVRRPPAITGLRSGRREEQPSASPQWRCLGQTPSLSGHPAISSRA